MIKEKRLVVDANILMRGALGVKVAALMRRYQNFVGFFAPEICFEDARRNIQAVTENRVLPSAVALNVLDQLSSIVGTIDRAVYEQHETEARNRIASRDTKDWPIVAVSLLLDCPIWTEDQDFFGSGVATWTTRNVELYLQDK